MLIIPKVTFFAKDCQRRGNDWWILTAGNENLPHKYTLTIILTLFRMGGQKGPATSFSPVTSINVEINP